MSKQCVKLRLRSTRGGLFYTYEQNGKLFAAVMCSFRANNSGAMFAPNRGNGTLVCSAVVIGGDGSQETVVAEYRTSVKYQRDALKLARKWIKDASIPCVIASKLKEAA